MIHKPNPARWPVAVVALFGLICNARALDPNKMISQYVRQPWSAESGFPGGPVHAIAQTADGYLWFGADKGLIRYDGFSFTPVSFSSPTFQNDPILGLVADSSGNLWVRLQGAGVLRYDNGRLEAVATSVEGVALEVTAIWPEDDGAMLLSDLIKGILRVRNGSAEILAPPTVLPGSSLVISMAEAHDRKIWIGTLGAGLFILSNGRATPVTQGIPEKKINCLLPVSSQEIWVGTDHGLYRGNGFAFRQVALPRSLAAGQILSLVRDRDSNIWVGTTRGLLRINSSGVAFFDQREIGSGDINALFEDREGNLWLGGARGVERIRDGAFVSYSLTADDSSEHGGPVYVDGEGRTWFAPAEGGLYLLREGSLQPVPSVLLQHAVIYSIAGRNDEIWLGTQHAGLIRLRYNNGAPQTHVYTQSDGLAQNSVYAVYESRDGTVWAGTLTGGISQFKDGRFVTYTTANGLSSNSVSAITETRDGATWFATPDGLDSWVHSRWVHYGMNDGLPSENVNCLLEDTRGVLWAGTSEGLAFFEGGRIHSPRHIPAALHEPIFGMAEDKKGRLWIETANRVLRLDRDRLSNQTLSAGDVREYAAPDGLMSIHGVKRSISVVADAHGRVWFSLNRALSVVDPSHLPDDSPPALAHVELILADNSPIPLSSRISIPSSPRRITFAYTGLSLAVPERIRFRYLLEDFDRSWSEPVAAREAVYTNLGPGPYRFRLIASNSDGQWNGPETSVSFYVEPSLWQNWWFRSLCVMLAVLVTVLLYRLRLHQMSRQLNVRFEERLAERMRIAQELHDTLLQGVLSASMQLNVADDKLDAASPAKPLVERVLELMEHVVQDGRNAVRGLRLRQDSNQDLDRAFSRIPQELAAEGTADFRVVVEGSPRQMHPVIRDEVYRIGREAVANAFRHSGAKTIEVEVEYGVHEFRVSIRDNGCGIDPNVLQTGRDGHWGLQGMRERAERIGAKLKVWSGAASGTQIDLRVPGRTAFESVTSTKTPGWIARLYPRRNATGESDRDRRAG